MKNRNGHIQLLLMVAVLAALSGCENRRNGLFGSDNWGRNGYSNAFLNTGVNPYLNGDGQVVGYLVHNQSANGGAIAGANLNPQAGGVQTGGSGANGGAGGIEGGATQTSGETPCTFKVASVSPSAYAQGSNQNFAGMYNETAFPSSGRGIYQTGGKLGVTCGTDSEVAATQTTFFISGGSNSNTIWMYRANTLGAALGTHGQLSVGPTTKITASPSGHVAAVINNGSAIALIVENRIGGDSGRIADFLSTIPAPNGWKYTDVVIDDRQGALYAGLTAGGVGQVAIFNIHEAYGFRATFQATRDKYNNKTAPVFSSQSMQNFNNNMPNETAVSYMFRQAMPTILKNNNGLTGVFTSAGHPFFMETGLGLDPTDTYNRTPEELNDIYANASDAELTVQDIRVMDPFQTGYHGSSPYVQQGFKYKDFAVGNNVAYMITEQGGLYTIGIDFDNPTDASTPRERRLNMGLRPKTIEMSYDQKFAIIAGTGGVAVGNVVGNNLIFSATGRADIQDGDVIHATALAKVPREVVPPAAAPTNETASNPTSGNANQ